MLYFFTLLFLLAGTASALAAPAAPILLSAALSGLAAASWTAFGAALLLGALSYALTPKVKSQGLGNQSSTLAVRQSDLPRQFVYGHTRIVSGYGNITSTGVNGELHVVMILCDGELRAITEVWLDDYSIPIEWIDANGNVTQGRYANKLTIIKHLGAVDQQADPLLVSNISDIDNTFRLQGIAYIYLILKKDQDVYPNGVPNITAIVEGKTLFDPRINASRWTTNIALYAHDFIRAPYGFAAFEDDVNLTNIAAQASICDEMVAVTAEWYDIRLIDHTLETFTVDADILPYEYGDAVRLEAVGGDLPTGILPDVDYYIIPYQVKTNPRFMLAATFDQAMNKDRMTISDNGTGQIRVKKVAEPRYHGAGSWSAEESLSVVLNNIVSCMAGRAISVAGFWTVLAGAWRSPAVEYSLDDVRGSGITIQNMLSMSDSYNVVKGLFYSQLNNYQTSDYPSAFYPQFVDADNGIEASKELNLPFCSRPTTAQRIAKIELFRGRQEIVFKSDFSLKGLLAQTGDTIYLSMDRYGWETKAFEITEFILANQNNSLYTQMTLRETAQQIYDWSAGEAIDYDPAPNTTLPNIFDVMAPTGLRYSSRLANTREGDALYTLTLGWNQHPDLFVREFGDFEIQFRPSYTTTWYPSFFVDGSLVQTDVVNSSVNVYYDVRIRARNNLGVRSGWNTLYEVIVGHSGGAEITEDWRYVYEEPDSTSMDWGYVYEEPDSTSMDWGYVT